MKPADLKRAFARSMIRVRYKRAPAYFVTDAQLLCCKGGWRDCQRRKEVIACIDGLSSKAQKVYEQILQDPPKSDLEMQSKVSVIGEYISELAVTSLSFYYRKKQSYHEQKGYDLMVESFAKAVVKLEVGEILKQIRTPFGWHIVRLNRFESAREKDLSAISVRKDIGQNILLFLRKRDVQRHIFDEMKKRRVKIHFDRLTQ